MRITVAGLSALLVASFVNPGVHGQEQHGQEQQDKNLEAEVLVLLRELCLPHTRSFESMTAAARAQGFVGLPDDMAGAFRGVGIQPSIFLAFQKAGRDPITLVVTTSTMTTPAERQAVLQGLYVTARPLESHATGAASRQVTNSCELHFTGGSPAALRDAIATIPDNGASWGPPAFEQTLAGVMAGWRNLLWTRSSEASASGNWRAVNFSYIDAEIAPFNRSIEVTASAQ